MTTRSRRPRALVTVLAVVLCVLLIGVGILIGRLTSDSPTENEDPPPDAAASVPLGSQGTVIATETFDHDDGEDALLTYDVRVRSASSDSSRGAMIGMRVECGDATMQTTGKATTNIRIGVGGRIAGQALTGDLAGTETTCQLIASLPFAEPAADGPQELDVDATFGREEGGSDLQLIPSAQKEVALTQKSESVVAMDKRLTVQHRPRNLYLTLRLTSCTVVSGSRDGNGPDACKPSMTGYDSSTSRVRVLARSYDADGKEIGRTGLWDDHIAIDRPTHHVAYTFRITDLAEQIPAEAETTRLTVLVSSVAGPPVAVHRDGTDAVLALRDGANSQPGK